MNTNLSSSEFTVDDIHKIRENNYEIIKNMSLDEKIHYYNNLGKDAEREIEKRKSIVHV